MKKNKLAFSLIELAVVVLIIGLITTGIIKGTSIIRSARISSARALTTKSNIAAIPGMVAWYETSLIDSLKPSEASDTSQITEWRDISPGSIAAQKNKLTRSASSAVIYKVEGINNLPSINFISSGNLSLSAFYQGNLGQATIFVVARPVSAVSTAVTLLDSYSSASTSAFGISTSYVWINLGAGQTNTSSSNAPSIMANSNCILATYYDDVNSKAFVNNATGMAGGALIYPSTNPLSGLTIATNKSAGAPFTGLISEIIIFDHPLPIDERKSVMSYLSKKYKISVTGI